MNKFMLAFFLLLSVCAAEPVFAHEEVFKPQPVKWYAVYVWQTRKGEHVLNPASVKGNLPQSFANREVCEFRTAQVARRLNEKFSGYGKSTVYVLCIAARNKLQLRQHIRMLDLNFGGQPA